MVIGLTVVIRILSLSSACISTVYKKKNTQICIVYLPDGSHVGLRPCSYCVYWKTALLLLQSQDNIMLTQNFIFGLTFYALMGLLKC